MQKYLFNRAVFGVNCMPFILGATIIQHMNALKGQNEQWDEFVEQFLRDLYMDDEMTAFDDVEDGKRFYDFSKKALADAGLDLRKWESNS